MIAIQEHPLLEAHCFITTLPKPLGELPTPEELLSRLSAEYSSEFVRDDDLKQKVRQLLRHGGYRPSGRGKPASEYLAKAVPEGKLSSINLLVDLCNIASFHSGLPISVVDLDKTSYPLAIRLGTPDEEYIFNASGQTISLKGLICLCDENGPCANAVKDSQRTKTSEATTRSLTIVWGSNDLPGLSSRVSQWYQAMLQECGCSTETVTR